MKPVSCIGDTTGNGNTRWHIDAATLAVLEKVFTLDQFPNVETRKQLGAELGVSTRQIQVWFQNRRQRERKNRSGLGRSNSGLEGVMPTRQATPLSSCEEITTVLFEFGAKKDDNTSLCALPLAPMPRLNSPTSTSGGSIPSTPGGSSESLPMDSGPPCDAHNFSLSGPNQSLSPPSVERPLARPHSLLASAQPRPIWPGGTASISSWTPPPSSVPPKGGPASLPQPLPGALPPAPVAPPDVAAKLTQACQTSLIGRTLQDYGGIVQVITEPRAPFHVLSVSPGWERLTGYSRDEVVGRPLKVLQGAQTEPEMIALLMRSVQEQRPVSVRITNYTKQVGCGPLAASASAWAREHPRTAASHPSRAALLAPAHFFLPTSRRASASCTSSRASRCATRRDGRSASRRPVSFCEGRARRTRQRRYQSASCPCSCTTRCVPLHTPRPPLP